MNGIQSVQVYGDTKAGIKKSSKFTKAVQQRSHHLIDVTHLCICDFSETKRFVLLIPFL